jgi:hypothetical protein
LWSRRGFRLLLRLRQLLWRWLPLRLRLLPGLLLRRWLPWWLRLLPWLLLLRRLPWWLRLPCLLLWGWLPWWLRLLAWLLLWWWLPLWWLLQWSGLRRLRLPLLLRLNPPLRRRLGGPWRRHGSLAGRQRNLLGRRRRGGPRRRLGFALLDVAIHILGRRHEGHVGHRFWRKLDNSGFDLGIDAPQQGTHVEVQEGAIGRHHAAGFGPWGQRVYRALLEGLDHVQARGELGSEIRLRQAARGAQVSKQLRHLSVIAGWHFLDPVNVQAASGSNVQRQTSRR